MVHINSKRGTIILWAIIALVLAVLAVKRCSDIGTKEDEVRQQKAFEKKEVKPTMRKVSGVESEMQKHHNDPGFNTEDIRQTLTSYQERLAALQKECNAICDYLKEKAGKELPNTECGEWNVKKKRLDDLVKEIERLGQEAQDAYKRQVEEWESAGAKVDADAKAWFETIGELAEHVDKLRGHAAKMQKEVISKEALHGYRNNEKSLKRGKKSLVSEQDKLKKECESIRKAMSEILGPDGKVNPDAPGIKGIVALLPNPSIPVVDIDSLPPPTPLPDHEPPFEPDVRIVTTGDLAEELAKPLLKGWLGDCGVIFSESDWKEPDEITKQIAVKVPPEIQGKEQGKLRIQIITERNSAAIFSWLRAGQEKADIVLTGRRLSNAQRAAYDVPEAAGNGLFRARVCSDALLFFRGEGIEFECLNAHMLLEGSKVYSSDDVGRMEAASIFGFAPNGNDILLDETRGKSIDDLRRQYRDQIILGVWHKDGMRGKDAKSEDEESKKRLRTVRGHELSYSSEIDINSDGEALAYRRFLREYQKKGCPPLKPTINAGRYAYAYDICFYRSTTPRPEAAAGENLLEWAGNAKNERVAELVEKHGFVPVRPQEPDANAPLTNEDLPIDKLIQKLPESFGYVRGETVWVKGMRFNVPLFYRVGDKNVKVDSTYRSGVEKALGDIKKLTQGKRACLVLAGHADPQYGKKLDASDRSWNFNDKLSLERANVIYADLFGKECPDTSTLMHVTLGCSWAFPVRDIDLSKRIAEQEDALERCRRVEVFLVFPRDAEDEGEKKE